jgi:hypothetical protein
MDIGVGIDVYQKDYAPMFYTKEQIVSQNGEILNEAYQIIFDGTPSGLLSLSEFRKAIDDIFTNCDMQNLIIRHIIKDK